MYINLKGQSVFYQTTGSGKNLILLHGWKQDVSTWHPIVDLLKDDFKLWMIDLPGFGKSDIPEKTWQVSNFAETVSLFIKDLKIKEPILLGHSLGGNVSLKLAIKYPDLLNKLILEDSSGIRPKSNLKNSFSLTAAKIFNFLVPNIGNIKEKARRKFYNQIGSDYLDAGELKETFKNIINEDLSSEVSKIKTETLIIWGERDQEVPVSLAKKLYQLIKNSDLEILEGIGHFPHLENPKLFAHYVKEFL